MTCTLGIAVATGCAVQTLVVHTRFLLSTFGPGHMSHLSAEALSSSQTYVQITCMDTMS